MNFMKVLFFGQTAEIVGKRELDILFKAQTKSSVIFAELIETYPTLKACKLLFAINQEYANGDELLRENDELAVFTAVSGG
jgi:sulfur-carrier protein